jgi:lipopolysaccharide/colanic/teichoic acid biosynthesis glycosyltransferase
VTVCERAAAVILLLLALPLLVVCALALGILSGRTPLIAHRRVGWRGAPLWMLKVAHHVGRRRPRRSRLDRAHR